MVARAYSRKWFDRLMLALIVVVATIVWGVSFTSADSLEHSLNRQAITVLLMGSFTAFIFFYAKQMAQGKVSDFFVHHQWWLVGLFSICYAVLMSTINLLKHNAFETHAFDLAIFDQAIWSTLNGKFLFSSFKNNICLLGDHMSPALILFAPFYWLWNDSAVLLVAEALVTASCFFLVALIAQEKLGKGIFPVFFAFALFFYQPLRRSVHADFHPELLANPVLFAAFYFLMKEKLKLFFLSLFILVTCKENMYGASFMLGVYLIILKKHVRLGLFVAVASLVLFFLATRWIMPHLAGAERYFYQANYNYLWTGTWGAHPPLFVHPFDLLEYLWKIFLPLGFLSFFHPPTLLLTFPILFQNILSRNSSMHSISYQYTSGLTPFVFISAIYGTGVFLSRFEGKFRNRPVRTYLLMVLIALTLASAGRPEREYFLNYKSKLNEHKRMVRKIVHQIPSNFSIVVNETLAPHASHRFQIRQFEDFQRMPVQKTYSLDSDLVILDRELTQGGLKHEVEKVQASGYRILYKFDGFFILRRPDVDATRALPQES